MSHLTVPHPKLEAKSHITVQRWIDEGNVTGRATTTDAIREIHKRFCELLPDELLWVEDPPGHERVRVVPGELHQHGVQLGQHVAISPGAIPRFLAEFERTYARLGKADAILAAARLIIFCSGFTRFSTAMAASRG